MDICFIIYQEDKAQIESDTHQHIGGKGHAGEHKDTGHTGCAKI